MRKNRAAGKKARLTWELINHEGIVGVEPIS
jgi:hypothetical protein